MPSADELTKLYDKKTHINDFIEETTKEVELHAKHGGKSTFVDVPVVLTRAEVEGPLREAFPGCKIKWKWFLQSYKISW